MTEYVKEDEITVKQLKEILEQFDDDIIVKFIFNSEHWNLTEYNLKEYSYKGSELVFGQKFRNIRHHVDGRWFGDHTSKKGFWIDDKKTGRRYYCNNDSRDTGAIVDILNEYEHKLTGKTYKHRNVIM